MQALLASDKGNRLTKNDIAAEATWADVLRDKSPEARLATSAWHSSASFKPDNPDLAAACFGRKPLPPGYPASRGPQENCSRRQADAVPGGLKNPETSQFQRLAALQFVLNLVGDINDPLNAIDRGDQGGHCAAVQIGSKPPVRLSTYWEETLVREAAGATRPRAPPRSRRRSGRRRAEWARAARRLGARQLRGRQERRLQLCGEPAAGKINSPSGKEKEPCGRWPCTGGPDYERALAAVKSGSPRPGCGSPPPCARR